MFFEQFDSKEKPRNGIANFHNGVTIPIFIRDAGEYDAILKEHKLKKIAEDYPLFTSEFIETYKPIEPTDTPEYLILGYQKI